MSRPLRRIGAAEFSRRLKGVAGEADKRVAFFIGAGCSVSSKIPAAGSLVRDHWLPRLRDVRAPHRMDLDAWAEEALAGSDGHVYHPRNPAASYGAVIQELFLHQEERQREIERLCDGRFPGFGYAVLAGLMAMDGGRFNIVLTTNFDDLVADALYLYTAARPLVIHHESLANFIRPTRTRPLVVKLHGDHRLSPQNTWEETERLKGEIEKQIRTLLHDRGLVFLGYGGNDRGIKEMLEGLPPEALPLGVYWLSGQEPACPLRDWLADRHAVWVEAGDFDQAMLLIQDAFDLAPPKSSLFDKVSQNHFESYKNLSAPLRQGKAAPPEIAALQAAVRRADASFPDWRAIELAANWLKDRDPDQVQKTYLQGIDQFPQSAPLLGNYANFLRTVHKDHDRAEAYYQKAIEADPKFAIHLSNYALFLQDIRKDYDRAEAHFQKALEADPKHASLLGNYAGFLLGRGRQAEGLSFLDRALTAEGFSERPTLAAECWCYAFVHRRPEERAAALKELKAVLSAGGRSPGWDLAPHLAQARTSGRADLPWLEKLAAVISDGADLSTLDGWAEWNSAS